jgi:hypothetical protein
MRSISTFIVGAVLACIMIPAASSAASSPPHGSSHLSPSADVGPIATCPTPTEQEYEWARARLARALSNPEPRWVEWRMELGLVRLTEADIVPLLGSEHAELCSAFSAVSPYMRDGRSVRVYFEIKGVYLSVSSILKTGFSGIAAFNGEFTLDAFVYIHVW